MVSRRFLFPLLLATFVRLPLLCFCRLTSRLSSLVRIEDQLDCSYSSLYYRSVAQTVIISGAVSDHRPPVSFFSAQ